MILVDTSVWVLHLRYAYPSLEELLDGEDVLAHPFVIGELACGRLLHREQALSDLRRLPAALVADHEEVLRMLDENRLWGRGIGWVDAHLLSSTLLTGCRLWTLDKPLRAVAAELRVNYSENRH